jgi:hypothetical protein
MVMFAKQDETFLCVMLPVLIALTVLQIVAYWKIFAKAGHSGAMSLLLLIPVVGFIVFVWFAFSRWPIEDRLMYAEMDLESKPRGPTPESVDRLIRELEDYRHRFGPLPPAPTLPSAEPPPPQN